MHTLPRRQDVLALEESVGSFLEQIREANYAVRLQPTLRVLLTQASAVFDTRSVEGLVEITSISKDKVKKALDGYSIGKDTARLLLRNILAACQVQLAGRVNEAVSSVGEGWVHVPFAAKSKAEELQGLLGNLLNLVQGSNLDERDRALSAFERIELIAILETALLHLKAPLVHKPFIKGLGESLKKISAQVAEKQVEIALSATAATAATAVISFLSVYLK